MPTFPSAPRLHPALDLRRLPRLVLHRAPIPSELEQRLAAAAERAADAHLQVLELVAGEGVDPPGRPCLSIELDGRAIAHYLVVPEGPEGPPFRELLAAACSASAHAPPVTIDDRHPERISVFVTPACPRCPVTVRSALGLAVDRPWTTVAVIDIGLFSELAEAIPVRSVPTLVTDTGLTVIGAISRFELESRLAASRGRQGDLVVLRSLVEAGRFTEAGRRLAAGRGTDALADLWLASTLEVRLGLLLTVDEALARSPDCLDPIAARVEVGLQSETVAVRGDTADLLRRLACPASAAALGRATVDPDPDVAEVAAEALVAIAARRRQP